MRILYIEDNPINVYVIQRVAEYLKCELLVAATAAEGMQRVAASPNLILLDLGLPDRDGLMLARDLRNAGVTIPIVALSAAGTGINKQLCLESGCTDYVSKPYTFNQMCRYVSRYQVSR